jgi:DNA (cytosine-5)-methyltransferase 1
VLKHHHPDVPNHGDFTSLIDRPELVADIDVLIGGCPCQAFSISGLRKSLADERGNLTLQFIRLANAIDDIRRDLGKPPLTVVYENVPGIFSADGNPFGCLLAGLAGADAAFDPIGGWPNAGVVNGPDRCAAFRVMDAQFFGLAQRRQRAFVVACGGARRWSAPDALLPIIESVRWHSAPRRETRQRVAGTFSARTQGGGGLGTDFECDGGLHPFDKQAFGGG